VGMAHVPGIVANWGHSVDCSAKPGGLRNPRQSLSLGARTKLGVALLSVSVMMGCANVWFFQSFPPHPPQPKPPGAVPAAPAALSQG
jgi:hypothetical protein